MEQRRQGEGHSRRRHVRGRRSLSQTGGLSVKDAGGSPLALWHYAHLTPGAPISKTASDVLLRNKQVPRATLFIAGQDIGKLVISRAPQTAQSYQRLKIAGFSLIATAITVASGLFLFFGGVSVSKTVAHFIPPAIADKVGRRNIEAFGPVAPACANQPGNAALRRVLDRLAAGGNYGPPFKLHVAQSSIANAFALPGRHIVLLSGLVKQAKSPEEVAGVIAHEMGHGLEDDPEALFVRGVGMQTLISFLTGQSGNETAWTAGALLLQFRYSRDAERTADAHAIWILRNARIAPKPTAEFFLRDAAGGSAMGAFDYLSTHPASKDRAQLFQSQPDYPSLPVLTAKEWEEAQAVCGAAPPAKKPSEPAKLPQTPKPQKA